VAEQCDHVENITAKSRIGKTVSDVIDNSARVLLRVKADAEQSNGSKITLLMPSIDCLDAPSRFERIAPQLFNLEPGSKLEKHLNLDLKLYQMENF
jgi:hypothetical protein